MFCFKCGAEIADNSVFCEKCGQKQKNDTDEIIKEILNSPKVILDPKEQTVHKDAKDSGRTASSMVRPFGIALLIFSSILAFVAIPTGIFPITIVSMLLWFIGLIIIFFARS